MNMMNETMAGSLRQQIRERSGLPAVASLVHDFSFHILPRKKTPARSEGWSSLLEQVRKVAERSYSLS